MHTRSAKNKETGKFTVTVWDFDGNVYFTGEFADMFEADRVAAEKEREVTFNRDYGAIDPATANMTLDEILAELEI